MSVCLSYLDGLFLLLVTPQVLELGSRAHDLARLLRAELQDGPRAGGGWSGMVSILNHTSASTHPPIIYAVTHTVINANKTHICKQVRINDEMEFSGTAVIEVIFSEEGFLRPIKTKK